MSCLRKEKSTWYAALQLDRETGRCKTDDGRLMWETKVKSKSNSSINAEEYIALKSKEEVYAVIRENVRSQRRREIDSDFSDTTSEDDDEDTNEPVASSGNAPVAKITPSNPKIQINETISFSASGSSDEDGDDLSFFWNFEGDSKEYEGRDIDRNFPDKGEYLVTLTVTDSTGLSDDSQTTVLVVENYHDEQSGNVNGNDNTANIEIPVEKGFLSFEIDYSLESANVNPLEESQVTLRLTDADGAVVQEENGVSESSGTWSYSTDDLSSTGDYIFTIESESGSMDYDLVIDVTY